MLQLMTFFANFMKQENCVMIWSELIMAGSQLKSLRELTPSVRLDPISPNWKSGI